LRWPLPFMAPLRHAGPTTNVGFQGETGSNGDDAKLSQLTQRRNWLR
jgi:hypothetical protein